MLGRGSVILHWATAQGDEPAVKELLSAARTPVLPAEASSSLHGRYTHQLHSKLH